MRIFIIKTSVIIVLSIVLLMAIIFIFPLVHPPNLNVPAEFAKKLNQSDIIICGDSRADRQIDPAIIFKRTKLKTLNIAAAGLELYAISRSLKAANISNKTIIISVSFFQVNDGAIDNGYFSLASYNDLLLKDKLKLYSKRPMDLITMQCGIFRNAVLKFSMAEVGNLDRKINIDYDKQPCKPFYIDQNWFNKHPWYQLINTNNIKQRQLIEGIKNLSALKNCKVMIYNAPVSGSFITYAKRNGIYEQETKYDKWMQTECTDRHIIFHSFLNDTMLRRSAMYYDPQHLCEYGTSFFTNSITDLLYRYKLIP